MCLWLTDSSRRSWMRARCGADDGTVRVMKQRSRLQVDGLQVDGRLQSLEFISWAKGPHSHAVGSDAPVTGT